MRLFIALFFPLIVSAQTLHSGQALKQEIYKLDHDTAMLHASWSLTAYDLKKSESLIEHHSNTSLIPASCLKLATTSAGLAILGENFKFQTTIGYLGAMENGTLNGDLVIIGGGDPTLGSSRVEGALDYSGLIDAWARKISAAGIKKINGKIIADASLFEANAIPDYWSWTDIGNYYGAAPYGLNFNENYYKLFLNASAQLGGDTKVLRTEPVQATLQFENKITTGTAGSGDNAYIYGAPFSNYRYLQGTIPLNAVAFSIKGSMADPALSLAGLLAQKLNDNGIPVNSGFISIYKASVIDNVTKLFIHESPALKDIIKHTNQRSVNLYAEAILKTIGVKKKGKGTTAAGVEAVQEYWKSQGVGLGGWYMYDGSGLSPANAITAKQMLTILKKTYQAPYFGVFDSSLPVAGATGTLSRLCKGTAAELNLHAKSGNINKVTSYAGYVKSKTGKYIAFVMIANNYSGENSGMIKRFEKLMIKLAEL